MGGLSETIEGGHWNFPDPATDWTGVCGEQHTSICYVHLSPFLLFVVFFFLISALVTSPFQGTSLSVEAHSRCICIVDEAGSHLN